MLFKHLTHRHEAPRNTKKPLPTPVSWFGTVTYKRSKVILSVQTLLGQAQLDTTIICTQIDNVFCKNAAALAWGVGSAA